MDRRDVPATSEIPFIDQIKDTWEPFQENWVVVTISAAILSYVPFLLVAIPACIVAFVVAGVIAVVNKDLVVVALFPIGIIFGLLFAAAYNAVRAGWTRMLLALANDQQVSVKDLKSGMPWFMDFFLTLLIIGVGTTIGTLFFIVPGILFAVRTSFAPFLVVDENLGPLEALKKSNEMVTGYSWQIFGYYCVMGFANIVISFIPIIQAVLIPASMGFFDMVLTRLYLYRKGASGLLTQR